jgi:hypothetical protein
MVTKSTMKKTATHQRLVAACVTGLACLFVSEAVQAQEILMTGPLAGAPAVRRLRLYREGRFELTPTATFSILNEYNHSIMFGATLNYNITDWLALGVWGSFGAVQLPTALTENIEKFHEERRCNDRDSLDCRLAVVNLSPTQDFRKQVSQFGWIASPQLTITPFRGKISMFSSLYVDTELHLFGGFAAVGLNERADCSVTTCATPSGYQRAARTAFTGSFGLGLTFFTHQWGGLAIDWRALPLSRNTGGFDTNGTGPNDEFPDLRVNEKDREFKFNQFISVGYSVFFPFDLRISE